MTTNMLSSAVPKLDVSGSNWAIFAIRFQTEVQGKDLWGHFDGSEPRPVIRASPSASQTTGSQSGATPSAPTTQPTATASDATPANPAASSTASTPATVPATPLQTAVPTSTQPTPAVTTTASAIPTQPTQPAVTVEMVESWVKNEKFARALLAQ